MSSEKGTVTKKDNKKVEELRAKVDQLKNARDELNAQLKEKKVKLRAIYKDVDKLLKEAGEEKNKRDEANKHVSEYKDKRDKINKDIATLNKKLNDLKKESPGSVSRRDYEAVKKEYDELNWKMQTSPLPRDREAVIIKRLDELEASVKGFEKAMPLESEISKLEKDVRKIRKDADHYHKLLIQESEAGEKFHEAMHKVYKKVDALKATAKEIEKDFGDIRKQAEEKHNAFVDVLKELHKAEGKKFTEIKKFKAAEIEKLKKEQVKKEEDILSDLKSGKVIKTEDLIFLQDM
jgi:uncharacterized coiled-coil DUF342 family protein